MPRWNLSPDFGRFGGTKRNRLFMTGSQSLRGYVETRGAHIT
jgi:hypothetical protein